MNIDEFKLKMIEKFPNENYSIIYAGKNSYEKSKIKCLDCGQIITINTGELFRKRKKILCSKCNFIRQDTINNSEKVKELLKGKAINIEFFMERQSKNGNYRDKVRFTCNKCYKINEKFVGNILRNNKTICNCDYCSGMKVKKDFIIYQQELEENYPNKFTILTDYVDVKTNIKVRCNNCGFIRTVKPTALMRSGFCPKCSDKKSLGENAIEKWLIKNNIEYEKQKYFKNWNIGIHYFDFYLPAYNLVIEFHGKQHYQFIDFFHKNIEYFKYRQEKDNLKKITCLDQGVNYLSIKYNLYNDIYFILSKILDSTTISKESKGKCLEIETFPIKEEDIVWT